MLGEVQAANRYRAAALRNLLGLLDGLDVLDRLAGSDGPILLLAGRDDFATSAIASQDMHERLPNPRLVIFEQRGHFPFMTQGAQYIETVEERMTQF